MIETNQSDNEVLIHEKGLYIFQNQLLQNAVAVSCYPASSEALYEEHFSGIEGLSSKHYMY